MRTSLLSLLALSIALPVLASRGADPGGPTPLRPDDEPPRLDDGRPHRVADWESLDCAACHRAFAEEWSESLHGLAWVDPHYQEALRGKRRPQACYGCHVPAPLHAATLPDAFSRKPETRAEDGGEPFDHGITCRSCHEGPEGQILGPFGNPTDAHVSEQHEHFTGAGRDVLCSACHATTVGPVIGVARGFESGEDGSCVGCHMPIEYRPLAVDGEEATEERAVRSHRILGPWDHEFLASAFETRAFQDDGFVRIVVENGAGHRIPGLLTRWFELHVRLLDADGAEVAADRLAIEAGAHLPARGKVALKIPGAAASAEVRYLHFAPGVEEPIEFHTEVLRVRAD